MSTNENAAKPGTKSLTILLPGGRLTPAMVAKINEVVSRFKLDCYLSTAQNLRFLEVREEDIEAIKQELAPLGLDFKGPGKFPLPKICVGRPHCNMGVIDTNALSQRILERFGGRTNVKPKFKIAVAGCTLSCSGALLADIGVVATRNGFDVYAGGKGGPYPKVGRRIARNVDEQEVLDIVGQLVDFHDAKTSKKQRMIKLLDDPEFPFAPEA